MWSTVFLGRLINPIYADGNDDDEVLSNIPIYINNDNKDDDAIYDDNDDNDDNDYAMMMMTSLELVAIMLYGNVYNI